MERGEGSAGRDGEVEGRGEQRDGGGQRGRGWREEIVLLCGVGGGVRLIS